MRFPDFIIAGAARSGTTWLYHLLDRHPQIGMAKPVKPEPKFFLVDDLYARGLSYYAETWFAGRDEEKLGEKSTNYLEDPRVAGRIYHSLPEVKLIFILREPGDRAWSNYRWSRMNGLETESFDDAIAHEETRAVPERLRYARPFAYLQRGRYAELLRPYYDLFPRARILILKYEDIAADPAALAVRTHAFIGVEPRPGDVAAMGVINASEGDDLAMPAACRRQLYDSFASANRRLAEMTGEDFGAWMEQAS